MHVHAQRGCRGGSRQPLLQTGNLVHAQTRPAELFGHKQRQIAALFKLFQIFEEERVITVILCGTLPEALQKLIRQVLLFEFNKSLFAVSHTSSCQINARPDCSSSVWLVTPLLPSSLVP